MKKTIYLLASGLITMQSINAQCNVFNCASLPSSNVFDFENELPTIGGYSNTDGDVCYSAINGIISTGTNYNNWDNLSFTSLGGNFVNNKTLNVQSNDNVYVTTGTTDTMFMTNFQNFEGTGTININGNLVLNNVVVNNSYNDASGNKAIINMTSSSYIKFNSVNGIIEGYGYEIEYLIPDELKVYNDGLIGYKAEGTLMVGHTTGKFIFFNICDVAPPLSITFLDINIKTNILEWTVSNTQDIQYFEIENSTNGNDWTSFDRLSSMNKNSGYAYDHIINTDYPFYRIKAYGYGGGYVYSDVVRVQTITPKMASYYIDVLGRKYDNSDLIPMGQVYYKINSDNTKQKLIK